VWGERRGIGGQKGEKERGSQKELERPFRRGGEVSDQGRRRRRGGSVKRVRKRKGS